MPTRHLHPRSYGLMVFGGGGGDPAPAPVAPVAAAPVDPAEPTVSYTSSKPELNNQFFGTLSQRSAAETEVDKDNKAIADYEASLGTALSGVNTTNLDQIGKITAQNAALSRVPKPTTKYNTGKSAGLLSAKLGSVEQAQQDRNMALASGARLQTEKAMVDPSLLVNKADVSKIDPNAAGTGIAKGTGSMSGPAPVLDPSLIAATNTAAAPTAIQAGTTTADTAKTKVDEALKTTKAQTGTISAESVIGAATKDPSTSKVMDLTAAVGTSTVLNNPANRTIQQGELVSGVADAAVASAYTEQVQAATATPSNKATVQGQLTELMSDFDGGATPAWASGALRNATAQMAARGLGASSMAGQALVQAAMEAALPIAVQDAQTVAGFEMTNLSNRQQRAMLAAQQRATFIGQEFDQGFQSRVQNSARIADVANMNFTADQSIALENSRNANTMNLSNLSNRQAMVIAQSASISQLDTQNLSNQQQAAVQNAQSFLQMDMTNLSNRQAMVMAQASSISGLETQSLSNQQQAAVQNAQSFLQMDMTNLSNRQQTELFRSQSLIQSIMTDQAATNASRQFNASSENQTNQFMSNLQSQISQFNSTQVNATTATNAGAENAASQFNAQLENQRDQFNAQNALVIAQANAQWRQNSTTINSAAQNEANVQAAQTANAFTQNTLDQIWQRERDIMDYAYQGSESSKTRDLDLVLADKKYDEYKKVRDDNEETDKWATITKIFLS